MTNVKLIFHIGAHKTGTTYLQRVFEVMKPALSDCRILVPASWRIGSNQSGHHQLAVDLARGASDSIASEFKAIATSGYDYALISSEDLSGRNPAQLALLASLLEDFETSFVFYFRRWSDFVPSAWQESIRHGYSHSLTDYIARSMANPERSSIVNFGIKIDRFASLFGRTAVSIVSYSNIVDSGLDLAHHFFDTFIPRHNIKFDIAAGVIGKPQHTSMPIWQVEIIRHLNALAFNGEEVRNAAPRLWFRSVLPRLDVGMMEKIVGPATGRISIDDNNERLRTLHQELFEAWGDRLVPPMSGTSLFEPRVRELAYVPCARFEEPAARKFLLELFDQYRNGKGGAEHPSRATQPSSSPVGMIGQRPHSSVPPVPDVGGSVIVRKPSVPDGTDEWHKRDSGELLGGGWILAKNGGAQDVLGEGWRRAEGWGVWGIGEFHELRLPWTKGGLREATLQADVRTFLAGTQTSQQVTVLIMDTVVAEWTFDREHNRAIRSASIPIPTLPREGGENLTVNVRFVPRNSAIPSMLDASLKETRPLGIGLYRLRVVAGDHTIVPVND